jgi:ADP-ribosyl-[dinitrogen reductase] hydrolase
MIAPKSDETGQLSDVAKRALECVERRAQYPADMGFLPFSNKFTDEPVELKTPWLADYFRFRNRSASASPTELRNALIALGADGSEIADRFRGALLGLAVGDALGTTLEFAARDSATVVDMVGGGPFHLKAGGWTDDTSMACCLAYSLLKSNGFNAHHVMECFSYWYRFGAFSPTGECFDIGTTTRLAIDQFLATGDPYAGSADPSTAGNGSIMRLAPVVLYYLRDFDQMVQVAEASSRLTHAAAEAVDACRYFACLLWGALSGVSKEELLDADYEPVRSLLSMRPLAPSIERIARGSYKRKSRNEIKSTGYVVDTLEAALWAFFRNDDFKAGALEAVNLAGDADTVGAVYGQLSGAFYGETAMPIKWVINVSSSHGFYHFAQDLLAATEA